MNEGKVKITQMRKATRAAAAKRKASSPGAARRKAARKEKNATNRQLPASVKLKNVTPKDTKPGDIKRPKAQVKPETSKAEAAPAVETLPTSETVAAV